MKLNLTLQQRISLLSVLVLILAVFVGQSLVRQEQRVRTKAAGSTATLSFYPVKDNFKLNETKVFELKATFTQGSVSEKIDYFKTEIKFSNNYLVVPSGKYIDTSVSGLDKIFRVDGPQVSTENGKTIIEVGASTPGSGPATDKPITLARIYYTGVAKTPSPQEVTIGTTQVVNNNSANIPVTLQGFTYTVGDSSVNPTPTPTVICEEPVSCPAPPPNCRYEGSTTCFCGNLVCWEPPISSPTIPVKDGATFSLEPPREHFEIGEMKYFEVKATFPKGSSPEKIDYLKMEITFQLDYLKVPSEIYVDTSMSGLDKIFRVDGPVAANQNGRIMIELGASTPGSGPSTEKPVTVARIYFTGKNETPSDQQITIGKTQAVNNASKSIPVNTTGAWYSVGKGVVITPMPPGEDQYLIQVGNKQWLVLNIGPATTPQIRFKTKLSHVQKTPDLYLKMRVKDELAFMNTRGEQPVGDTCNNTPPGTYDFWVPVKADKDGVYSPVPSIGDAPPGMNVANVSKDGWVMLDGVSPGKYHSFFLKGPKTRSTRMAQHILLQPGQNQPLQDFNWTDNTLDPGDLPDPNDQLRQNCTVNSIDISLITGRLGKTDGPSQFIADVNYDGVINGNDVSKVVNTLSTKPDDDQ